MNLTRDRLHSLGWMACLAICGALLLALTLRVNAVKSEVRLTERKIVALQQESLLLETEFETRANQQQLRALNDLEFGYQAPAAGQYLEGERQLARFGKPRAPGAPAPIMVAHAATEETGLVAMVSPLTGKAMAAEMPKGAANPPATAANLRDRLSRVEPAAPARE